jgi:hypothetical protein
MRITTLNQIFTESDFRNARRDRDVVGTETALAQHAAAPPSMKTIGTPAALAE